MHVPVVVTFRLFLEGGEVQDGVVVVEFARVQVQPDRFLENVVALFGHIDGGPYNRKGRRRGTGSNGGTHEGRRARKEHAERP